MSRFSQAISEGDGISVIPLLEGDVGALAAQAEEAGAEAVAVRGRTEVGEARAGTGLPIIIRVEDRDLQGVYQAGADACVLVFDPIAGVGEVIESLYPVARDFGLDCVVDVRDEEGLTEALERLDPEIFLVSSPKVDEDEEELERVLDLLPDVPAGKLVIAETRRAIGREQVLALERAGVDGILIAAGAMSSPSDLSAVLAELTGR